MTPTDDQFNLAARAMATDFLDTTAKLGLSQDDSANLAGAALGEVLAQELGAFGAVERLRSLADVFEQQVLDGIKGQAN